MNTEKSIYNKLAEYLNLEKEGVNILEQQIDTDVQFEYFEYSSKLEFDKSDDEILLGKGSLFDNNTALETKKTTLIELASVNRVEAYRIIEEYLNLPNIKLYDWACMALQESRLKLESNLLDTNKVLITTGLGGKGKLLRYFIVFFTPNGQALSRNQQKIIFKELQHHLKNYGAELEDIIFDECFASVLSMVPFDVPLKELFHKVLDDCNYFGNFLYNDYIITNLKALNKDDIRELLAINNIY